MNGSQTTKDRLLPMPKRHYEDAQAAALEGAFRAASDAVALRPAFVQVDDAWGKLIWVRRPSCEEVANTE